MRRITGMQDELSQVSEGRPAETPRELDPKRPAADRIVLIGINHTTAPIEVRERLAIPPGRLADATKTLVQQAGIREGLILSTCNRVEFLTLEDGNALGARDTRLTQFFEDYFQVAPGSVEPHLYELRGTEAVRHLFRVASSLDSMVVGEPQILGQVKESWTVAKEVGAVGGMLDPLFQRAFSVAKRVRSETEIGSSSVSIASVAVDLARKIFGSLHGKTVLLVGAGKMSELAARHLVRHGAGTILVTNRTEERARTMAERIAAQAEARDGDLVTTQVIPFDGIYAEAPRADIVITSTGSPRKLFGRSHARQFLDRRRHRPMFFIDIAVPRDVDPKMNEIEGCFVYDIDDLQQVAQANQADRGREAEAAESIVAQEVALYEQHLQTREAAPAIKALQQSAESIREAEIQRTLTKLAGQGASLTPGQVAAVEAMTRALTQKLIYPQIAALKKTE